MKCKKCEIDKCESEFYRGDKTCKACRRAMVKANREAKADYYREYDRLRFQNDPRVKERHKRYLETEQGKLAASKAKKRYIEKNPIKRASHIIVGNAIRDGKLVNQPCEVCGDLIVHAHHDDYAFPMQVRWLCNEHHNEWHRVNGDGANAT